MLFSGSAETVNFSKNPDNKLEIIPPGVILKISFLFGEMYGKWCIVFLV